MFTNRGMDKVDVIHICNGVLMQETQEMWVQPLGWDDPLEEEVETQSSLENSMDREA